MDRHFLQDFHGVGQLRYKESEDALRVTVKPQAADFHEALAYDIDQPTENSALVTMRWEKMAVPFKVSVNVNEIVAASLHKQLRGLSQYTWDGWDDAATYLLAHKTDLDEALQYEDRSIQVEERYDNLMSRSQILDAMGKKDDAKTYLDKALAKASPQQLHQYAFQLKGQKKDDEAYAVWRKNAKDHPDLWFTHSGMARVYSSQGDFPNAVKEMKIAEAGARNKTGPSSNRSLNDSKPRTTSTSSLQRRKGRSLKLEDRPVLCGFSAAGSRKLLLDRGSLFGRLFRLGLLGILEYASPRLSSQASRLHVLHQQRSRPEFFSQGLVKVFEDVQTRVESHQIH